MPSSPGPEIILQRRRADVPAMLRRERVDCTALLASLRMPIAWKYDPYIGSWLPAEMRSAHASDLFNATRRISWDRLRRDFARNGLVKIPALLPRAYAEVFLTDHYARAPRHDRWAEVPPIKRTFLHNMPVMQWIHRGTRRMMCDITGEHLKTSYSFAAAYEAGSTLPAHVDRPQCRYNVSLLLGANPHGDAAAKWPLWIRRNGCNHRVALRPGDAVLYSGARDMHWRNAMPAELDTVFAVFFHYVRKDFLGSLN